MGEIKRIAPDFLAGLKRLHQKYPDWLFVTPLINEKVKSEFDQLKQTIAPEVPISYFDGQSRTVMQAANQILLTSGTAVLEGMLVGRPMVAAYRVAPLTAKGSPLPFHATPAISKWAHLVSPMNLFRNCAAVVLPAPRPDPTPPRRWPRRG